MTILQSSQRDYTEKIKTIQSLSEHYGAYIVDTIAAFNNRDRPYEELCNDGTHPNDEEQKVYYETVKTLMDDFYLQREQIDEQTVEAVNKEIDHLKNFRYYSISDFQKVNECTYEISLNASLSMLGIDYACVKGEDFLSVYADEKKVCDRQIGWDNDFTLQFVEKIMDKCEVDHKIQIEFSSREQMENFHGIIINEYILSGD